MTDFINDVFWSKELMAHGHCYLWRPGVLWLQVVTNGLIAAACLFISATLGFLVYRVRDLPFRLMYAAFGVFIVACGATHIMDVYVIWRPAYWLDGGVRAVTALASLGTAIALPVMVPRAIALARGTHAAHQRGIELETIVLELGSRYQRSREVEQTKTQFFANVSHDFRTQLALILGPTEKLLAADNLTPEQRRDLELVTRNARTLFRHVNDLLDVSRLEAGKASVAYAEVDVTRLLRVTSAHLEGLARDRGIEYAVNVSTRLAGQVDPDKLQRVVLNLLSNAFKFAPAGGRVRLEARRDARGWLVIEVADSGEGIQPEHREVVFERFRQLDGGPTRRFGGAGLGLAIAKDFVTLHGGTLAIGEAPEGGALVTAELPLQAPAGTAMEAPRAEQTQVAIHDAIDDLPGRTDVVAPVARDGRPLILVVDDNPDMNRFLCDGLADGYQVAAAHDGERALALALETAPDLVVTDLMMPGMSGDQLVRELRRRPAFDHTPIILLTAKDDDELRIALLKSGAQDYLMKPFALPEVRARVANLVTMKRARDVLQVELDTQTKDLEQLAREVTARKRELDAALVSVKVARETAERASEAKSSFLGMVSHELRTPLTALKLQLERLHRDPEAAFSDRQKQVLRRMASSSDRLGALIESLLQYTRIQSGRLTMELERFDLAGVVAEVVDELRPYAEDRALGLRIDGPSQVTLLMSDRHLVRLILVNLVGNALKFTERGEVTIAISAGDLAHRVAVSDSGAGIASEDQVRIFEPFAQVGSVRQKHVPGIGLGLALVREMTGALGGRIELRSELGAGSTFTVSLPSSPTSGIEAAAEPGGTPTPGSKQ